jgi:hypothetical protein
MPLNLNLGLRRDFKWRFVVADVTHPLIGVDCRNNRLLDRITLLSVQK